VASRILAACIAAGAAACMPPSWGASGLLHPVRRPVTSNPALGHRDVAFVRDGLTIRGWLFHAKAPPRGITVVYLHGIGDNRESGTWIAERLVERGFDVLTYDSRGQGASDGSACTYGFHEKGDLRRALDEVGAKRAVVVGASLGAAVALQAAPQDSRIIAVVAVATFADLASVARERAPLLASGAQIEEAFAIAEREGRFRVAGVSPVLAARWITVPVLLVHGAQDHETGVHHSRQVLDALAGPKELLLVEGAGHGDALGLAWHQIEEWIARQEPPS
jgi:hypothetical protein